MKKKLLFVYNPKAGREKIRENLAEILDVFADREYELTVVPTRAKNDAKNAIKDRGDAYDLVVVCGGDGTLDEAVTGMIQSGIRTPMGYIPGGSTNDFGESLGLSKNMVQAAKTAVDGQDFACDIGAFNEDVFVYIAAFGLFTDVSYETDQAVKNVLGHGAYVLEGIKRLSSIKSYSIKVSYENQEIEDDFIFGMISNSRSVGGFKNITGKDVHLDDGLFEVTLVKMPANPADLSSIMGSLFNRDIDSELTYCFRTDKLVIESKEPIAWTLDGENGGEHARVEIRNLHGGIVVRVN